ncbi:MAG: PAS domain S-box protein, partial [Myxococcales bacterium]|nr:PAS domain S-box protein [Myxococcales bacterium]
MVETSYNERALQAFLNALTEPALLLDRELTLRAGNLALAERVGLPLTELVGAKQMSFLSPEMAHSRLAHAQRCLDSAQPVVFEDSRAGRHFVNHVMPVLGDQGSVTGVAIVAIDVTRRRRAEQMMRDSESRCQTIISTCVEGVWQIDAESMTSFVNPQMASMLGYSIDEFLGKSMYDFMDDKAREVAEENVRRRQRGISEEHDFRFKHKDDRDVWASLSTNPIHGADGEYIGAVAMVTDITERRVLEQRMLQSQKLESLGVLAGGIAHDFNNLLVGILANVSLAERMVSQQTAALPLLAEVRRAAEAAANLTNELLAYSGKGPFTTEPVDLQAVVAEVSALLTAVISKHARLELNFASNLPAIVADATQVRQVIMNLVTNASDAIGDEPGTIMASTFVAHLDPGRLAGMQLG